MRAMVMVAAVLGAAAAGAAEAAPGGFGPAVGAGAGPVEGVRAGPGRGGRAVAVNRRHGPRGGVPGPYGYAAYGGYGYGLPFYSGYAGLYGDPYAYGYGGQLPYEFRFRAHEPPPAVPAVAGIPAPAVQPPAIYVIGGSEREGARPRRTSRGAGGEGARVIRVR